VVVSVSLTEIFNILDVLTYMFDYLFEVAEQDASQEIDDTALKAHLSDAHFFYHTLKL
jgi:hypothetical protein